MLNLIANCGSWFWKQAYKRVAQFWMLIQKSTKIISTQKDNFKFWNFFRKLIQNLKRKSQMETFPAKSWCINSPLCTFHYCSDVKYNHKKFYALEILFTEKKNYLAQTRKKSLSVFLPNLLKPLLWRLELFPTKIKKLTWQKGSGKSPEDNNQPWM